MTNADYIVVGAGPAGCALAARLADAPQRPQVTLIETGPARPSLLSRIPAGMALLVPRRNRHNYAFSTEPQPQLAGRRGYVPRGRGVGGSSLINAMIYVRGQPEDYDHWAALGCAGWSWSDVLPLFRSAEGNSRGADAWHGDDGPLRVADLASPSPIARDFIAAAIEAGYPFNRDFNGARQEGVGLYQVFQHAGRRFDAGAAFLGDDCPRPNLTVLSDTRVERVTFDRRRATGVAVAGRQGRRTLTARREVILAAGAIASPQLLMLSGVGPAAHLSALGVEVVADAPEVGANLQDHLDYPAMLQLSAPGVVGYDPESILRIASALPALARGTGMLTTNAAEAGGFVKSDPTLDRPDLQFHFCVALVDDHCRRFHLKPGVTLHVCALRPESRGQIRLISPDPAKAPSIDPRFLSAAADRDIMLKGARAAHRILNARALAHHGGKPLYGAAEPDDAELIQLIRDHADTIYHPVGSCRMGADARAVVTPELRVRGVDGLRIADASIMPTIVSGNTQAPSAMIGAKAAELILNGSVHP